MLNLRDHAESARADLRTAAAVASARRIGIDLWQEHFWSIDLTTNPSGENPITNRLDLFVPVGFNQSPRARF